MPTEVCIFLTQLFDFLYNHRITRVKQVIPSTLCTVGNRNPEQVTPPTVQKGGLVLLAEVKLFRVRSLGRYVVCWGIALGIRFCLKNWFWNRLQTVIWRKILSVFIWKSAGVWIHSWHVLGGVDRIQIKLEKIVKKVIRVCASLVTWRTSWKHCT